MRIVAGRLKNDYRYAPSVYYNFPFPKASDVAKHKIEVSAQAIIEARKLYFDKCLADMYGDNMFLYPELLEAHHANDAAVLEAYGFPKDATESDIVARLFKMYQELTK
ncbi:MAG: methylase [Bacteroidales bacterium]|nr:methylase [Bacteroidales bacterium]